VQNKENGGSISMLTLILLGAMVAPGAASGFWESFFNTGCEMETKK
jgi:hypothetical protein